MTDELIDQIRNLIDSTLFPLDESVSEETDLHSEGLDSLMLMQLIVILEKEFSVTIAPADLDRVNFSTLTNIASLVRRKRNNA